MQDRGIEVRAIGPHWHTGLLIKSYLRKNSLVSEGTIKSTCKNRFKVNNPGFPVIEMKLQFVCRQSPTKSRAINRMNHGLIQVA